MYMRAGDICVCVFWMWVIPPPYFCPCDLISWLLFAYNICWNSFLPLFRGADIVFRKILVPLSGQYENLLLRDAHMVRREMERHLHKDMIPAIRVKAAHIFLMDESKLN